MSPGDTVEAKLRPGLGGWLRCTLVTVGAKRSTVTRNGDLLEVKPRHVRPVKDDRPKRAPAPCPLCAPTVHRMALCPKAKKYTRPSTTKRPEMRAVPKAEGPFRSEPYLAYVRRHPCMWCEAPGPSDPDHVGPHGMAQKADDFRTVPMCRAHHEERHRRGRVMHYSRVETLSLIYQKQVTLMGDFFCFEREKDE